MILREKREELLRTLAFFSFFPYPITSAEATLFSSGLRQEEVDALLREWEEKGIVDRYQGFVVLRGAKLGVIEQVAERSRRYLDSMHKLRLARFYFTYLTLLPWVEGFALCNSIAWQYTRPESDTDLFILVRPGHLFTTRLFVVLPLMLLRMRPSSGRKHAIDTNFFVATDALDLSSLREHPDPYFDQWMRALIPLYEHSSGLFERLFCENPWALARIRTPKDTPMRYRVRDRRKLPLWFPERFAKWIEEGWFPEAITKTRNQGTSVVINDSILKFHKNDRRAEISRHVSFLFALWSSKI